MQAFHRQPLVEGRSVSSLGIKYVFPTSWRIEALRNALKARVVSQLVRLLLVSRTIYRLTSAIFQKIARHVSTAYCNWLDSLRLSQVLWLELLFYDISATELMCNKRKFTARVLNRRYKHSGLWQDGALTFCETIIDRKSD